MKERQKDKKKKRKNSESDSKKSLSKETTNAVSPDNSKVSSETYKERAPFEPKRMLKKLGLVIFALLLMGTVYVKAESSEVRIAISYLSTLLFMVIVYTEVLSIRDHIWLLEASLRQTKQWRNILFNKTTLRKQKLIKVAIVACAAIIFSLIYKVSKDLPVKSAIAYMASMLMLIILYSDILNMRDELFKIQNNISPDESLEEEKS